MSPRPTLGRRARTLSVSVKLSQSEKEALAETYGTVYAGLRAGINLALNIGGEVDATPTKKPDHLHARGELLRTEYQSGSPVKIYKCRSCDKELS